MALKQGFSTGIFTDEERKKALSKFQSPWIINDSEPVSKEKKGSKTTESNTNVKFVYPENKVNYSNLGMNPDPRIAFQQFNDILSQQRPNYNQPQADRLAKVAKLGAMTDLIRTLMEGTAMTIGQNSKSGVTPNVIPRNDSIVGNAYNDYQQLQNKYDNDQAVYNQQKLAQALREAQYGIDATKYNSELGQREQAENNRYEIERNRIKNEEELANTNWARQQKAAEDDYKNKVKLMGIDYANQSKNNADEKSYFQIVDESIPGNPVKLRLSEGDVHLGIKRMMQSKDPNIAKEAATIDAILNGKDNKNDAGQSLLRAKILLTEYAGKDPEFLHYLWLQNGYSDSPHSEAIFNKQVADARARNKTTPFYPTMQTAYLANNTQIPRIVNYGADKYTDPQYTENNTQQNKTPQYTQNKQNNNVWDF